MKNMAVWVLSAVAAMQMAAGWARAEIIVRALVDGPSELIVTTNGFHWKNGMNAKPGRHEGRNEPTYINDKAWYPKWAKANEERGTDKSETYSFPLATLEMEFELLAVGDTKDVTTIEPRTQPTMSHGEGKLVISIPDPEPGSKWYVFSLTGVVPEAKN